jgi:hypothetical protein
LREILTSQKSSRISLKTGTVMLIGMTLCGVSSGTLVSATGAFLMTVFTTLGTLLIRLKLDRTSLVLLLTTAAMIYVIGNALFVGILKNLTYYGGFTQMLDHGYGRILLDFLEVVPGWFVLIMTVTVIFTGIRIIQMFRYPHLTAIFLFACICGAFGYSTLSVATIPMLVLGILYLNRTSFFDIRRVAKVSFDSVSG